MSYWMSSLELGHVLAEPRDASVEPVARGRDRWLHRELAVALAAARLKVERYCELFDCQCVGQVALVQEDEETRVLCVGSTWECVVSTCFRHFVPPRSSLTPRTHLELAVQ